MTLELIISTYTTRPVHKNNVHISREMHSQSHKSNSSVENKTTQTFLDKRGGKLWEEGPFAQHRSQDCLGCEPRKGEGDGGWGWGGGGVKTKDHTHTQRTCKYIGI